MAGELFSYKLILKAAILKCFQVIKDITIFTANQDMEVLSL